MDEKRWKILAADDETELLDTLELFFKRENIEFIKAADGLEAIEQFRSNSPDLVLLDIMMPGLDGFSVLQKIREVSKIPAIMITARVEDYDKILGLTLGADDYVTKPYNPLEVVARVKAQLRRNYDYQDNSQKNTSIIKAFNLELDKEQCIMKKDGEPILLTKTEYRIMELLMSSPGRIYTKQQIFDYAWEEMYLGDDSTIMVHMSNLRSKIEKNPKKPDYLKTIKGLGYKFEKPGS